LGGPQQPIYVTVMAKAAAARMAPSIAEQAEKVGSMLTLRLRVAGQQVIGDETLSSAVFAATGSPLDRFAHAGDHLVGRLSAPIGLICSETFGYCREADDTEVAKKYAMRTHAVAVR
jgi:hypothetical protein